MTIKKELKIERKSELQKDAESATNMVGAGAKALFNKLDDSYTDLKVGYQKEKDKQKLD
ncbi:MAG: hypothetical protein HMLIMOIP_002594 [Candidatus Nitrosomirales archaeon]|jgi:hypothetical protein